VGKGRCTNLFQRCLKEQCPARRVPGLPTVNQTSIEAGVRSTRRTRKEDKGFACRILIEWQNTNRGKRWASYRGASRTPLGILCFYRKGKVEAELTENAEKKKKKITDADGQRSRGQEQDRKKWALFLFLQRERKGRIALELNEHTEETLLDLSDRGQKEGVLSPRTASRKKLRTDALTGHNEDTQAKTQGEEFEKGC